MPHNAEANKWNMSSSSTVDVLESTVARISDGITRLAEIRFQARVPTTQAGPPCRWCLISNDCETGQEYLADESF